MEKKKFQMPHTYIIIFGVILVAALLTCFIPLGKYDTKEITYTVNGSEKTRTVVDPDTGGTTFWYRRFWRPRWYSQLCI